LEVMVFHNNCLPLDFKNENYALRGFCVYTNVVNGLVFMFKLF